MGFSPFQRTSSGVIQPGEPPEPSALSRLGAILRDARISQADGLQYSRTFMAFRVGTVFGSDSSIPAYQAQRPRWAPENLGARVGAGLLVEHLRVHPMNRQTSRSGAWVPGVGHRRRKARRKSSNCASSRTGSASPRPLFSIQVTQRHTSTPAFSANSSSRCPMFEPRAVGVGTLR